MTAFSIKICGLSTPGTLSAALDSGADMVGFVFHPKSPRFATPERFADLARRVEGRARKVALMVNPTDDDAAAWADCIGADLVQLHGAALLTGEDCDETPERVAQLGQRLARPILKAVGVSAPADLALARAYQDTAAMIVLDAKPPKDAAYPGGHGRPFDWDMLAGLDPALPVMLSGGLTPANVAEAITVARSCGIHLAGVDVSTGVESGPGVKDIAKIGDFVAAARSAAGRR